MENPFGKKPLKKRVKDGIIHATVSGVVAACPASFFIKKPEFAAFILTTAMFNSFLIGFLGITDLMIIVESAKRKQK